MKRFDWTNVFVFAVFALAILLGVGVVYQEIRYPCLQYTAVQTTCGGETFCTVSDAKGHCLVWSTQPTYPCTVQQCVRRKP